MLILSSFSNVVKAAIIVAFYLSKKKKKYRNFSDHKE